MLRWRHIWVFLCLCRTRLRLRRSSKRFVFGQAIPTCWRIGESKKLGVFNQHKHKTANNNNTNTKQHKKTPRQLRETLRFQKVPKPLSTAPRCHSKFPIQMSQVTPGLEVYVGGGIYGILRKEVADERGHLPAQATTTLA